MNDKISGLADVLLETYPLDRKEALEVAEDLVLVIDSIVEGFKLGKAAGLEEAFSQAAEQAQEHVQQQPPRPPAP